MFHRPHDAQVILDVGLPERRTFSDGLYTFEPERFSLDALVRGEKTKFKGTIYRGSFEAGGTPLATGVEVLVKRIVAARYLQSEEVEPPTTYFLFGVPHEAYLVRRIDRAPGVDQILRATVTAGSVDATQLARGVEVILWGSNHRGLAPGDTLHAPTRAGGPVEGEVTASVSCLAGPDFDKPCR
jgi:hypothetical protein